MKLCHDELGASDGKEAIAAAAKGGHIDIVLRVGEAIN